MRGIVGRAAQRPSMLTFEILGDMPRQILALKRLIAI